MSDDEDRDDIQYGFNAEDETINFGTRIVAGQDNLFETCTLAVIKSTENDDFNKQLHVCSVIQNGKIFISINNTMRVFSNTCTEIDFSATFRNPIDTFCMTPNGKHLLLCLRNGGIRCFNTEDNSVAYVWNQLHTEDLENLFYINAFVENNSNILSFVVVLRTGKIYRIEIDKAQNNPEDSVSTKLEFSSTELTDLKSIIQSAAFKKPTLFVSSQSIHKFNVETLELSTDDGMSFKKLFFLNSKLLVGLNEEGRLVNISMRTFLYHVNYDSLYEDILLIDNNSDFHLLASVRNSENDDVNLQLLSYPDYSVKFSLKMTTEIILIIPENAHDEIIYLSKFISLSKINEIRFQMITETVPENRLKRLLRRKKFEEAENFAKLYNLGLNGVNMAKAQMIVDKIICEATDVDKLLEILNILQDDDFKIRSCLDVQCSCVTLKDVERILKYGYACNNVEFYKDYDRDENLHIQISNIWFRFQTFLALIQCGKEDNGVQEWIDFMSCNLIDKLVLSLEHHYFQESLTLYSHLTVETLSQLNEEDLEKILNVLSNFSVDEQLPFLRLFIPNSLTYTPAFLSLFITWMMREVSKCEKLYISDFPNNAISFINEMINLLKVDCANDLNFQHFCTMDKDSLEEINKVLNILKKLKILKEDYGFSISMQQFLQSKRKTLIETLLNKTMVRNIKKIRSLEEFIHTFISEGEGSLDEVYADIIKDMLKYSEEYWINVVPDLLNLMDSISIKLHSLLMMLEFANDPWCKTIQQITESVCNHTHPLVQDIMRKIEFQSKSIILKKPEYGFDTNLIEGVDMLRFAINRIIYCRLPTMVEDVYQICRVDNNPHEANMSLIIHFIKEGECGKAIEILNNNLIEETLKCCKEIIIHATLTFNRENSQNNVLKEQYYEILPLVFRKLQEKASKFQKLRLKESFKSFTAVYKINKEFDMSITLKDVEGLSQKEILIKKLVLQYVVPYYQEFGIVSALNKCEKISLFLDADLNSILIQFNESIADFKIILKQAEYIRENYSDSKLMCSVVTLILKNLGVTSDESVYHFNQASFCDGVKDVDLNTFLEAIKLAREITSQAILQGKREDLKECFKLSNWVQSTCFLMQDRCSLKTLDDSIRDLPSMSTLTVIRNAFELCRDLEGGIDVSILSNESQMSVNIKHQSLNNKLEMFETSVNCLYLEGCMLTAYKLIKTLQFCLMCDINLAENIRNTLSKITIDSTEKLLQTVMSFQEVDIDLAYDLLISYDIKNAKRFLFQYLKMYKRNLVKFKSIATLNLRFLKANNIEDGQIGYKNIIYLSKWWNKIENRKISYDHFFKTVPNKVLQELIELNCMNIPLIEEFCIDFDLKSRDYYELYLKHYLVNWRPYYTVNSSNEMVMKSSESDIYKYCLKIINIIENVETVVKILNEVKGLVNFYNYEVFSCVFKLLKDFQFDHSKKIEFLAFLKRYTRISSPGQTEIEEWNTLHPESSCIDFLSKWRLPFTPTLFSNKIWNIIRPEINLSSYPKWFDTVWLLNKWLTKDELCSYVVKDIISSGVFRTSSKEWSLYSKHADLLTEIDKCVMNISNLELATSTMYHLFNAMPDGADRVLSINLCYKYAIEYQQQHLDVQDVQTAFIKVQKKHFGYSTLHILYKNKLADEKYTNIKHKTGDEIILELYMDERIVKNATVPTVFCPDINRAVNDIADLYSINIESKRKELLVSWLSNGLNFNNSELCIVSASNRNKYEATTSEDLIRAAYLCTSDIPYWQKWLLEFGNVDAHESKNLKYKANALKCFCYISNLQTIEDLTEGTYYEFTNYINKLLVISNLESFGLTFTIDSLQITNKDELLKRLYYFRNHRLALQTMALICITFEINKFEQWSIIVKEMLILKMFQELRQCLYILDRIVSNFPNRKFYVEAWQAVVNNFLDSMTSLSENDLFIRNFYVIQSCPILYSLNYDHVIKKYFEFKKYDFAALIVPFLSKEKQSAALQEIFSFDPNIEKNIDALSKYGFWCVPHAKNLLKYYREEFKE